MMNVSRWIFVLLLAFCFACGGEPMLSIREDLCALRPAADTPDPSISIGRKLAVIYRDPTFEYGKFGGCHLDRYSGISKVDPTYLPAERYAETPKELETVVLIETRKGPFIERASAQRTLGTKTDTTVYAGETSISLIDRGTNKIARRITFPVRNVPSQVPQDRLRLNKENAYEYVCEPTVEEVRQNLERLLQD